MDVAISRPSSCQPSSCTRRSLTTTSGSGGHGSASRSSSGPAKCAPRSPFASFGHLPHELVDRIVFMACRLDRVDTDRATALNLALTSKFTRDGILPLL